MSRTDRSVIVRDGAAVVAARIPGARRACALLSIFIALLAPPLHAQRPTTGTLMGTVVDAGTAERLPTVHVAVRAEVDSATVATITNSSGGFVVPGLAAGGYQVTFSRIGYAPVVRRATVGAGAVVPVDLGTIMLTPSPVELTG